MTRDPSRDREKSSAELALSAWLRSKKVVSPAPHWQWGSSRCLVPEAATLASRGVAVNLGDVRARLLGLTAASHRSSGHPSSNPPSKAGQRRHARQSPGHFVVNSARHWTEAAAESVTRPNLPSRTATSSTTTEILGLLHQRQLRQERRVQCLWTRHDFGGETERVDDENTTTSAPTLSAVLSYGWKREYWILGLGIHAAVRWALTDHTAHWYGGHVDVVPLQ